MTQQSSTPQYHIWRGIVAGALVWLAYYIFLVAVAGWFKEGAFDVTLFKLLLVPLAIATAAATIVAIVGSRLRARQQRQRDLDTN
ncbi:hypothetical protein [Sphingomonas sp.]|uniref:hypothetical protein n=1 Tax=Sphingomonas sp. TaxID=28214 RepID=UPI0038A8E1F3